MQLPNYVMLAAIAAAAIVVAIAFGISHTQQFSNGIASTSDKHINAYTMLHAKPVFVGKSSSA